MDWEAARIILVVSAVIALLTVGLYFGLAPKEARTCIAYHEEEYTRRVLIGKVWMSQKATRQVCEQYAPSAP